MPTPYNANDPTQQAFLSALQAGESGGYSDPWTIGVGGTSLANAPTTSTGFPVWSGQSGSHAAGAFQFQPGTWTPIATQYGLNFQNPTDQAQAAWINATNTDPNLENQLKAGDYSSVVSSLKGQWPSVTGSNFMNTLTSALGNALTGGFGSSLTGGAGSSSSDPSAFGFNLPTVERLTAVVIGVVLVGIALVFLLSETKTGQTIISTGKTAAKAAIAA